jgi:hypothetical protein
MGRSFHTVSACFFDCIEEALYAHHGVGFGRDSVRRLIPKDEAVQ